MTDTLQPATGARTIHVPEGLVGFPGTDYEVAPVAPGLFDLRPLGADGAGFVTADAELGWRFGALAAFDATTLAVGVHNLADKRYHEHQTEGVSGNELAAPGRGIALSLNGSF